MANRRVIVTDFHGETTTSQYDTLGRVVTTTFPDGSSQSYTYTSSGQIAAVTDRHGTTQYQYDSDERLTSVTDANGATISYTYDDFGRTQTVTTPSGTTNYGYDTYGRLTSVIDADGAETRYTYDEHGNKATMMYPNGTITEYGYDTLNRLISVETRTMTNDLLAAYTYTLDAKGQRTHVEEQPIGRRIDYEYDAADRLIEEHISDPVLGNRTISYTYDPVGNRLTKDDNGVLTAYSDDNDRLLTETGSAYTYDNNGNMLMKTGNGEEWRLTYNALNQVEHADISTSQGTSSLAYTYDHDGIRIGKTINGTEVVQYVVDKNRPYAQVLEEQHTHGGLSATTSYAYGDALISAATEGSTHYYHTDGLGSVRHLSDASGALTDSYTYDAYGLLTTSSGATVNPFIPTMIQWLLKGAVGFWRVSQQRILLLC
jgi:YD repeat-containing protein